MKTAKVAIPCTIVEFGSEPHPVEIHGRFAESTRYFARIKLPNGHTIETTHTARVGSIMDTLRAEYPQEVNSENEEGTPEKVCRSCNTSWRGSGGFCPACSREYKEKEK